MCSPKTAQPLPPHRARSHPPDCCCRLHHGHRARPYRQGQRRHSPRGAQPPAPVALLLHCDYTAESRCIVLRPPGCQVLLKAHIASVCFKCFRYFRGMLQVFQMDVGKVDRDVAYGCTHMLQRSVTNISYVFSYICRKCVYLDVAYVLSGCCVSLQMFSGIFFKCYRNMLQVCVSNVSVVSDICCKCLFECCICCKFFI